MTYPPAVHKLSTKRLRIWSLFVWYHYLMTNLWEDKLKAEYEALPNNRWAETVQQIKLIIEQLFNSGLSSVKIGKLMDKDHTTVLHHLWQMGYKPGEQNLTKNLTARREREDSRAKYYTERAACLRALQEAEKQREAAVVEAITLRQMRAATENARRLLVSEAWEKKRAESAKNRDLALALYKKGETYAVISKKLGLHISSIEGLIRAHPDYQKAWEARGYQGRKRAVMQVGFDGKIVATYPSSRAAGRALGIAPNSISLMANGKSMSQSAGGFMWQWKN